MVDVEVPLALGQVYGFRFWYATQDGHLHSVTQSQMGAWESGVNIARCAKPHADPPPMAPPEPIPPRGVLRQTPRPGHWPNARTATVPDFSPDNPRRHRSLKAGAPVVNSLEVVRKAIEADDWLRYEREKAEHPALLEAYREELAAWERGESRTHIAPVEGCECGFYLVKDPEVAMAYARNRSNVYFGVVKGYGRTVSMHKGWKVQKAVIVGLTKWYAGDQPDFVYQLSRYMDHKLLYGDNCPICQSAPPDYDGTACVICGYVTPPPVSSVRVERMPSIMDSWVRTNYPDVEYFDSHVELTERYGPEVAAS